MSDPINAPILILYLLLGMKYNLQIKQSQKPCIVLNSTYIIPDTSIWFNLIFFRRFHFMEAVKSAEDSDDLCVKKKDQQAWMSHFSQIYCQVITFLMCNLSSGSLQLLDKFAWWFQSHLVATLSFFLYMTPACSHHSIPW